MRCAALLVLAVIAIGTFAHKAHPRFVHLRGHKGINTETHPGFNGESSSQQKMQFIVHVRGPVHHKAVARLEKALGVTFDEYLPHNSFLLYAPPSVAKSASLHPEVLWVGNYLPEYKTTSHVSSTLAQLSVTAKVTLDITLVRLSAAELHATIASIATAIPSAVISIASDNVLSVTIKASAAATAVKALAAEPAVHTIDIAEQASSPVLHTITGQAVELGDAGITPVTSSGLDGAGQVIGSGDSGITTTSCFIEDPLHGFTPVGTVFQNPDHRKLVLYNATFGDFADASAHGTPVVGAAAGSYWTADALNNYEGIAYNAKIAFLDLQTGSNASLNIPADLASSYFGPLVAAGAKVILSAWGSYNSRRLYTVQEQAVDTYLHDNPTVIALFSAGNDGSQGPYSISSPASSKNAIAVGASQNILAAYEDNLDTATYDAVYNNYQSRLCGSGALDSLWSDQAFCQGTFAIDAPCDATEKDNFCSGFVSCCPYTGYAPFQSCCAASALNVINLAPNSYGGGNLASFSSRGPTFDGRIKPDITAPGESVKTPAAGVTSCPATLDDATRAAQVTVSAGTSIAVANAAGAVALMRQYFADGYWPYVSTVNSGWCFDLAY